MCVRLGAQKHVIDVWPSELEFCWRILGTSSSSASSQFVEHVASICTSPTEKHEAEKSAKHISTCIYICLCMYVCMYVCIYIMCVYLCMYVCVLAYRTANFPMSPGLVEAWERLAPANKGSYPAFCWTAVVDVFRKQCDMHNTYNHVYI